MHDGDFWTTVAEKDVSDPGPNSLSAIKLALLFACAGVASALLLTPILAVDDHARVAYGPNDFDNIITGSIPKQSEGKIYTIRKSILQDRPDSICIIHPDGRRTGDC